MVTEIKCECGNIHTAKMAIEAVENAAQYIAEYCDKNVCNGKILVIGEEDRVETLKNIECTLSKTYKVKRIVYARGTEYGKEITADLSADIDECRLIIICGAEKLSALIKSDAENTPIINVFFGLSLKAITACKGNLIIIDRKALLNAADKEWAGYYGQLMMVLLNCLDGKINRKFEKNNNCRYLIDNVEKEITKLIQIEYDDFDGLKFKNNLTEIVIQTTLWLSMLDNCEFINTYDVIGGNLKAYYPEFTQGEIEGVLAWYIFVKYRVLVKFGNINALTPCDRTAAVEYLAKNIGYDKLSAFARLGTFDAEELAKRQFVYLEYREDIAGIIDRFDEFFSVAIKNFRRIYKDVGYFLKKAITFNRLASISDSSAALINRYSLYRHYFELGYLKSEAV